MGRALVVLYGVVAYALFAATFVYTVGFVDDLYFTRNIDHGRSGSPLAVALAIDVGWFVLFAVQHSGMARAPFKRWWTSIVPPAAERSSYVLVSTLMLMLLYWQWRPLPAALWTVEPALARTALLALSLAGWALVFAATCAFDHFEFFGLRQVFDHWRGVPAREPPPFATPLFYRAVRHPLYLGFLVAFWATPAMTLGHLVFALGMTIYVFVGVRFEERDLVRRFGSAYLEYRARVPMLLPWPRR
jgi:protein-S-isoprenylcysteine O-methyltransferase Ste14